MDIYNACRYVMYYIENKVSYVIKQVSQYKQKNKIFSDNQKFLKLSDVYIRYGTLNTILVSLYRKNNNIKLLHNIYKFKQQCLNVFNFMTFFDRCKTTFSEPYPDLR